MFTKRETRLLAILLGMKDWLPGKILAQMLTISSRTLQNEVAFINTILKKQFSNTLIASNNRLGYRLEGNRDQIKRFVAENASGDDEDTFESAAAILMVLLYEKDFITLNQIAERTFLAVSSISVNMEKVRKMIARAKGARLIVHPRKGYRLEAEESVKRMLIVNALGNEESKIAGQYPQILEAYELLDDIREILIDIFVPSDYIIEGKAFDAFCRYCAFSLSRQLNGYLLEKQKEHEVSLISKKISLAFKEELNYECTEDELLCLDERLEDLNVIGTTKKDYPDTEKQIKDFCALVSAELGLSIHLENNYLKRLSEHLHRMKRRLDVGNYLRTSDRETIEKQYPVALHLVRTCFVKTFGSKLPGNEERLLVPYIAALIDDATVKVNVNIVSDLPVGEVYRYRARMYEQYGTIVNRIRIFPTYLYEERFCDSDPDALFLTTQEDLVFRHNELTYIDLYEEYYQSEMILNLLKDKSLSLKKKIFDQYKEDFEHEVYEDKETDLSVLLKKYAGDQKKEDLSCTLIDNDVLLCISHGKDEHVYKRILLNKEVLFENKPVKEIVYYNIGRKEDVNFFCEYIKGSINKRI